MELIEYGRKGESPYFVLKIQVVSPVLLRVSYKLSLAFVLAKFSLDYMETTLPEIN